MNVDFRIAHQSVVHGDLGQSAENHGKDRQFFLAVGLQNGVGQNHQADKNGCDAQSAQVRSGSQCALILRRQNENHDGRGQNTQSHTCRQCQQSDDAKCGRNGAVSFYIVLLRQCCGGLLRIGRCKIDSSVASEAHTQHIDARGVHIVVVRHPIYQTHNLVWTPPIAHCYLWSNDDGINLTTCCQSIQRAILTYLAQVGTT